MPTHIMGLTSSIFLECIDVVLTRRPALMDGHFVNVRKSSPFALNCLVQLVVLACILFSPTAFDLSTLCSFSRFCRRGIQTDPQFSSAPVRM